MYYSQTNPPELGTLTTCKDEWLEKETFGYSLYEVTHINQSVANIKETKSGHLYTKIKLSSLVNLKELNQLN